MASPSRRIREHKSPAPRAKSSVRLANAQDQAASPEVRRWQDSLHQQWTESERAAPAFGKWSRRRTAAFITLTCGGFWTCVILGVTRLAH